MRRSLVIPSVLVLTLAACHGEATSPLTTGIAPTDTWLLVSVDGVRIPLTVDSTDARRERLVQATLTLNPQSLDPMGPRVVSIHEVTRLPASTAFTQEIDPLAVSGASEPTFTILGDSFLAGTAHRRADGSLLVESRPDARYGAHAWVLARAEYRPD